MFFIEQLPNIFEHSKTSKEQNLQAITVWITPEKFTIVPNISRSRIPTILQIDRQTWGILQHEKLNEENYNQGVPHYFSCLIGIMDLGGKRVMLLAEDVVTVGNVGQRQIFKVVKPIYLFYNQKHKKQLTQEQAQILLNTTAIFEQGMYFSYSYQLASRLDRQGGDRQGLFNWARYLQKQLTRFDKMWKLSVIQGFVGKLQLHINGVKLSVVLISRRATKRGGTQSYSRGVDHMGNAGNYVETEQIVITGDQYFSFLMVRGSAPFYWSQKKNSYGIPSPICEGDIDMNYQAFQNHLKTVQQRTSMKDIFLINLLSSQNQQKKLIQNYQYLVHTLNREDDIANSLGCIVRYGYFDIHGKCSSKQYGALNSFLQKELASAVKYCGFTASFVDREQKRIQNVSYQTGTFRASCYNCIDRTNIFQSRVAALKLIDILKYLEIELNQFKNGLTFFSQDTPFSRLYRNLWADNGDALSKQYIGTGSTESFAVRKGKLSYMTTLDHGMKSIFRAIRSIRNQDKTKQDAICFILGEELYHDQNQTKTQQLTGSGDKLLDEFHKLHRSAADDRYITI